MEKSFIRTTTSQLTYKNQYSPSAKLTCRIAHEMISLRVKLKLI